MSERKQRGEVPLWAQQERIGDLAWIGENLPIFWAAVRAAYEENGRGALFVDTTVRPTGAGHPFGYFSEKKIQDLGGADEIRMVAGYDPSWEMVIILLKPGARVSSYRVGVPTDR